MISMKTAMKLKDAGLIWTPQQGDRFAIPSTGFKDEHFIVSEMTIQIETHNRRQMIMFNGAAEWAMDYVTTSEAVWLPSEEQLRAEIETRLVKPYNANMILEISPIKCKCVIFLGEKELTFNASHLSETFGQVLYFLMSAN